MPVRLEESGRQTLIGSKIFATCSGASLFIRSLAASCQVLVAWLYKYARSQPHLPGTHSLVEKSGGSSLHAGAHPKHWPHVQGQPFCTFLLLHWDPPHLQNPVTVSPSREIFCGRRSRDHLRRRKGMWGQQAGPLRLQDIYWPHVRQGQPFFTFLPLQRIDAISATQSQFLAGNRLLVTKSWSSSSQTGGDVGAGVAIGTPGHSPHVLGHPFFTFLLHRIDAISATQ